MPRNLYIRGGVYWARFKIAGQEYRRSLFVSAQPKKSNEHKALMALTKLKNEIEDQVRHGIMPTILWQQAVVVWNEHILSSVAHNTYRRYLVSLAQCAPWLDGKKVADVNVSQLRELIRNRQAQGVTNATIRRDLTAISSVLATAQEEGWIEDNPALVISRRRVKERHEPIVLPVASSIETLKRGMTTVAADIVEFAIETGMRQAEIVDLEWSCIDLTRRVATLHKTKGLRLRAVPLNEAAVAILKRQHQSTITSRVFWHGEGAALSWISSRFGAVARKVAHKDPTFVRFRFHDLRHLFAVEYLREGGSIYELQGILGHASIKTTERYLSYLTPEQQRLSRLGAAHKGAQHQRFEHGSEDDDD